MVNRKNLKIFCDGACSGNPGNAGSGLALYEGKEFPTLIYGDYETNGTNNTAELNALLKALSIASNVNCSTLVYIIYNLFFYSFRTHKVSFITKRNISKVYKFKIIRV